MILPQLRLGKQCRKLASSTGKRSGLDYKDLRNLSKKDVSCGFQARISRYLPDRGKSKHRSIIRKNNGRLCIGCEHLVHIFKERTDGILLAWEQEYLKGLVLGNPPLVILTVAGFREYESAMRSYGSSNTQSSMIRTPLTSDTSGAMSPASIVYFGRAGLLEDALSKFCGSSAGRGIQHR